MTIKIFPNEISKFNSELKVEEIHKILEEDHYNGSLTSTSYITNKTFIGNVEKNYFELILSSPKTAMFCVFEGEITQKEFAEITLTKKFHNGFKWLFIFGYFALYIPILIFPNELSAKLQQILMYNVQILVIRYFVIKLLFRKSEQNGIEVLKNKLKLNEIN
ncbi:hypothetical protein RYR26_002501 [Flavobacterium psychrophilum]|nr:hypothetical protein [Flavobacterium psychrophilum]